MVIKSLIFFAKLVIYYFIFLDQYMAVSRNVTVSFQLDISQSLGESFLYCHLDSLHLKLIGFI